MSFANKGKDSKDTAKLRAEYQAKVNEMRDTRDKASAVKLRDDKERLFQRVVENIKGERRENLASLHKVLISQGRLKTKEQMNAEREKSEREQALRAWRE